MIDLGLPRRSRTDNRYNPSRLKIDLMKSRYVPGKPRTLDMF
jgi:hypothetical protein